MVHTCVLLTRLLPSSAPNPHPPPLPRQLFLAFNSVAHSLIATNLSRQREGRAAEVLVRIAQLAVAVSIPVAVGLFAARGLLPDLFTGDLAVRHEVAEVLPLLLVLMVRATALPRPSRLPVPPRLPTAGRGPARPSCGALPEQPWLPRPAVMPWLLDGPAFRSGHAPPPAPLPQPATSGSCALQPLDALGTVLEGGLLGASDTGYLGARTFVSCCVSLAVLAVASYAHSSLLAVWVGMKAINVTALALDLGKYLVLGSGGPAGGASGPETLPPQQRPPPK